MSQRRRAAANLARDTPSLKTPPGAARTRNKITGLEAKGVEDKDAPRISAKRKNVEAAITEEVPLGLSDRASPKKTKQRKEVKQEREDTEEQKPQAEETSKAVKRKRKVEEDQEPADPQIDGDTLKNSEGEKIVKVDEAEIRSSEPLPKKTKRKKATEVEVDETIVDDASPKKATHKTKVKKADEEVQEGEDGEKKIKRKRKTKEEKELEAMPLATRTDGLRMLIGAHVSGAKGRSISMYIAPVELRLCTNLGVHNSVTNCVHIG